MLMSIAVNKIAIDNYLNSSIDSPHIFGAFFIEKILKKGGITWLKKQAERSI